MHTLEYWQIRKNDRQSSCIENWKKTNYSFHEFFWSRNYCTGSLFFSLTHKHTITASLMTVRIKYITSWKDKDSHVLSSLILYIKHDPFSFWHYETNSVHDRTCSKLHSILPGGVIRHLLFQHWKRTAVLDLFTASFTAKSKQLSRLLNARDTDKAQTEHVTSTPHSRQRTLFITEGGCP